jgi:GDP-L-fucose synthase
MNEADSVFVAGHRGLVGGAIVRALRQRGFRNVLVRDRSEIDLREQEPVRRFFAEARPGYVFLAAAKVGGIHANDTYPADFIRDNLQIQTNVIDAAYRNGVRKLCFLGSSCVYPRDAAQPLRETALLSGPLESTNEAYAVAKIAGIRMCQAYTRQYGFPTISLMPTNLYGPGDNFDPMNSHVLPALIRRFHEAKVAKAPSVTVWGTGTPRREFLHVDDMAEAAVFLMERHDDPALINVGVGEDVSIRELAGLVAAQIGYEGDIRFDASRPDGTPRKLLDVSRITALGWRPRIALADGIAQTYRWYLEHAAEARGR